MSSRQPTHDLPDVVVDPKSGKTYHKGRFLGKGGFAKCYELTDTSNNVVYAGKVVPKSLLTKPHQKEKMHQEIQIHKSLNHAHVVQFHDFFEDSNNVYIILEYCRRRSLMELHRRRSTVTDLEARYFMRHILLACEYLHANKVIHRDLKLGNLFLDDDLQLKVGDFGLATKLDFDGERKRTLCGTPNYIAPEILTKRGHSFEVDVWSIGCILYTLLVGRPPFETKSLKETYARIKTNKYEIPSRICKPAHDLISRMLHADCTKRPTVQQILMDEFMTQGYLPTRLPTSCLTMAPRFERPSIAGPLRRPFTAINNENELAQRVTPIKNALPSKYPHGPGPNAFLKTDEDSRKFKGLSILGLLRQWRKDFQMLSPSDSFKDHILKLRHQLETVFNRIDRVAVPDNDDEALDPASIPIYWVSKWVDYTDKYGLGYQLCDNSVGVLFNDATRICLLPDGNTINYIDLAADEAFHTLTEYPSALEKKVVLLRYFQSYMSTHLMMAGAEQAAARDGDQLSRLPYLRTWFRTRSAIVLFLSNGTLQINFFQDHSKIILCPLMGAVSYIDTRREFRTYRLNAFDSKGITRDLRTRLEYAKHMVDRLQQQRLTAGNVAKLQ